MAKMRLTVAPGRRIVISPHPSGFPGLEPLVLKAGDTLFAEPDEAQQLWLDGLVLGLKSGKPIEQHAAPANSGITVRYGNGLVQGANGAVASHPNWAALVQHNPPEPVGTAAPAPGFDFNVGF